MPDAGQASGANAITVGFVNPVAYCFSANPVGKTVCAEIGKSVAKHNNAVVVSRCRNPEQWVALRRGLYKYGFGIRLRLERAREINQ